MSRAPPSRWRLARRVGRVAPSHTPGCSRPHLQQQRRLYHRSPRRQQHKGGGGVRGGGAGCSHRAACPTRAAERPVDESGEDPMVSAIADNVLHADHDSTLTRPLTVMQ